jgi:hypothetical protein
MGVEGPVGLVHDAIDGRSCAVSLVDSESVLLGMVAAVWIEEARGNDDAAVVVEERKERRWREEEMMRPWQQELERGSTGCDIVGNGGEDGQGRAGLE